MRVPYKKYFMSFSKNMLIKTTFLFFLEYFPFIIRFIEPLFVFMSSLVKIFDVSVPNASRILSGSFKDILLFPEETILSCKKRVATKSSDLDRIQTRKFRALAGFLNDFSPEIAQETQVSWKKRVTTKSPDFVRSMTSNYPGKCKISIRFCLRSFQDSQASF